MAATSDRDVRELLVNVDLAELLTELAGPPVGFGTSRRWHCPDPEHPDHHPSVSTNRGPDGIERWRCWSGGHSGTAIDALIAARRHGVRQAIEELRSRSCLRSPVEVRDRPVVARLELHPAAVRYVDACERIASSRTGHEVIDWLVQERHLDSAVLRVNRIGADPGPELFRRPHGLPRGGPAAVLPALNPNGAVVYLQARYVEPAEGQGKYDNPSARMGPNPRVGFVRPPKACDSGTLIVCEGLLDAYVAAGAGFEAVGVLGAGLPDRRVVESISAAATGRRVVVAFDNDDAGRRGSLALTRNLSDRSVQVSALDIPTGVKDLADWARLDSRWHVAVTGRRFTAVQAGHDVEVRVPEVGVPGVR